MDFSEKIKIARKTLKMSQEQIARELDVSFATINRLEKGKTLPCYKTMQNFEKLCKKFNISFGGNNND